MFFLVKYYLNTSRLTSLLKLLVRLAPGQFGGSHLTKSRIRFYFLFFSFFKDKKVLNNDKELEANGKLNREPEENQERSSVLNVFKKVSDVSSVGGCFFSFENICPGG